MKPHLPLELLQEDSVTSVCTALLTLRVMVTTESQPLTVCKVTFCVPAALKTTPFQV